VNNQPGNPADQQLVQKVLRGEHHAFGTIIRNTEALVAQIVFKMIPHAEDRKDLVQDIYLKAFHKLSGFKFQSKLSTWIATITYNTCLSWLQKKKLVLPSELHREEDVQETTLERLHHQATGLRSDGADGPLIQKELISILQTEIDQLPLIYRTLVTLYHQEDLSYEEMAQITGLPEGTVKSYLFRARKKLKETLLSKYKKEAL